MNATILNSPSPTPRWQWYHAAAVGVAANTVGSLPAGFGGDQSYVDKLNTPPGSPPGWLFPPVWAFNNATTLWSNLRLAWLGYASYVSVASALTNRDDVLQWNPRRR